MTGRRVLKRRTQVGECGGERVRVLQRDRESEREGEDADGGTKIALGGHVAHFHFLCPNIQFTDSCIQILVHFPRNILHNPAIVPELHSRVHAHASVIFSQCSFTLVFAGHVTNDLHISSRQCIVKSQVLAINIRCKI